MTSFLNNLRIQLLDEENNRKIVAVCTYIVLCAVSLVMTLLNVLTDKGWLTFATGAFALLSIINVILAFYGKRSLEVSIWLFAGEIVALFTFFLISGNPEGFSAIWICLLPVLGLFFFNSRRGSVICAIMLAIMIFLLWTPVGQGLLQFEYSEPFKMRFPILYSAFYLLALFLEMLRAWTAEEKMKLQAKYREQSVHDQLTEMFNRQGLYDEVKRLWKEREYSHIGALILDIDFFKTVNDQYGHFAGDEVLRELAQLIKNNLNATGCRWGGEEFMAVWFDDDVKEEDLENFRRTVEEHRFVCSGTEFHITVSIGVYHGIVFSRAYTRRSAPVSAERDRFGKTIFFWYFFIKFFYGKRREIREKK